MGSEGIYTGAGGEKKSVRFAAVDYVYIVFSVTYGKVRCIGTLGICCGWSSWAGHG